MAKQLNAGDYAILAEWKSPNTMIAGRAQPARALIALNDSGILSMVATVHHLKTPQRLSWPLLSGLVPERSCCWSEPFFRGLRCGSACSEAAGFSSPDSA